MKICLSFVVFIIITANLYFPCFSQQTVFNVPSADVTPKGAIFLQHESQFNPWTPA